MEALLSSVTLVFNAVVGWMGNLINVIVNNPVLVILCVAMPLIGFGVVILKRITSVI